ncbi:MAG: T9SS type A sorting domain-containing protein [Paludibacter sp.]|nr:T9SS type A sorting domain-containing protein [Paludibacter sp.]
MKNLKSLSIVAVFVNMLIVPSLFAIVPAFDEDKPIATYKSSYSQQFNTIAGWDSLKFYNQWDTRESLNFSAADIISDCLQFVWINKRIICSKNLYVSPYVFETEIDYGNGSNRGGLVIRANTAYPNTMDHLQEPLADPGFNHEGIAFYPSEDGMSMIVQFSGPENGIQTAMTRIMVPKPENVGNLKNKGIIRMEDFGTSVYIYYNGEPFIRINLSGESGRKYTSGTVYDAGMNEKGTFTGMEVERAGRIAVAQRDATLRLYRVRLEYNELKPQTVTFPYIGEKLINDAPFALSGTASSGLPVEYTLLSGPATLTGNMVTLTGQTGIVTITANQYGNAEYYPAVEAKRLFYAGDPAEKNVLATSQDYVDTWVATDALGRQLPSYGEVGGKRSNKRIGVFYYVWHGAHGEKVYNIKEIIDQFPSDPLSPNNPGWGSPGECHFWGEPETGYHRAEDPWVIRRDLQMLSNAKVDFIYIDVTNGIAYLETIKKLCEISMQMRREGIYTPQIVFTTHSYSGRMMNEIYDEFYANSLFKDLWFKWNGKPVMLGDEADPELRSEVKNFFTIKFCWAWTKTKALPNHWQWLDGYPQNYGWSVNKNTPEQIPVSMAQHPTSTRGTSFHGGVEPAVNPQYLTDYTGQGLHAAEQWTRALAVDPPVIMVTQWNEWFAQRFIWDQGAGTYGGRPIKNGDSYFVDAFTEEFNRDMAPMKGGHTDNYYYQLISNIRKYKGMAAPPAYSASKTAHIDGDFSEWPSVLPVFKDPFGDTMHRNFRGYDPSVTYVNNTGRNDILESRATYDESNLYFYVRTAQVMTPYSDPNWMLLFLDTDKNKTTGWEGYDYVVNLGVKSNTETTLKQWNGSEWVNEITIPYKYAGSEMELSVSRAAVRMDSTIPAFYFHWADNPQQLNDITTFFTDGESAPDRRFNYYFSPSVSDAAVQNPYHATFTVYPNPVTNKMTINSERYQVENVKIVDLQGKTVYSNNEHFNGRKTIDIRLEKGLYLLNLTGDVPYASQKFIVE